MPSPVTDRGSAPRLLVRAERRAVLDVLGSSVLFGACNVAWRYGEGPTVGVVFVRASLGVVLGWLLIRRRGHPSWRTALRTRSGVVAVLSAGASMVLAGTMFRTLDGPVAGLAIACTPAVAMLVRDRVGRIAGAAAVGSSIAAAVGIVVATGRTDAGADVGWWAVLVAVAFVAVEVVSMRAAQVAVEHDVHATAIVTASMLVAAVTTAPFAVVAEAGSDASAWGSAVGAAFVVAVLGTVGRVLRTEALPSAGVPAVAASTQVTALGTAVGGVWLFSDELTAVGVLSAVVAAGLGILAVLAGTRWRLSRDGSLARSLELAPEPAT
jgi:drug/metabolite transporter (DMT)-like permease